MLKQLLVHRQILYDLTAFHLEPLKGLYERLAYVAGLRDPATGKYAHETLSVSYPAERVSEVLEACHEEIFERLLESPLALLEQDLVQYFESRSEAGKLGPRHCRELTESWMPPQAPEYLKDLYCSNQNALCELLQENRPRVRSSK